MNPRSAANAVAGAGAAPWRAEPSAPPDLDAPLRARILIVDDDERNAFAAVEALADLGHDLVTARSGEEALKKLLTEEYALILLDVHMPGMDGYETAQLVRSRKKNELTPIVFLTAIVRDEAHIFQAYSAGAVDVVFKPIDPFILKAKVQVFINLHLKTKEVERQSAYQQWLLDEHGRVKAEKARAERALRRTEARQQAILKSLPIVFHSRAEPPFAPTFVSETVEQITGFPPDRFTSDPDFGSSRIHPDDLASYVERVSAAARTGHYSTEFRWLCADGQYKVLQDQGVMAPKEDGEAREIFGVILDATDRKSLEEQLAQARKMEAVGQLTGGVAHDFNNLLTVVLGNIDMLATRKEEDTRRMRRIEAVRAAAERGRDLTGQLLAFSRRQHLTPVTLDANALIRDFASLLRQAVGEAVTIELDLADEPLATHVDAAQLENALLNLAVNARDAMAEGGVLTIATRREPGRPPLGYVAISVADTGVGMDEAVRDRVFEPFFTTKDVGKGSGLGLSQVYGFVSQSDGEVRLESAPGQGTTFHLLLPASGSEAEAPRRDGPAGRLVGGTEKVLLVEDDATVLALTLDVLTGLGYQVTPATNAAEALVVLQSEREIDLLFTDVVMPGGVSGLSLARTARDLRPGLRVLLTSGFIGENRVIEGREFPLLDKPYETAVLASTLRKLLDRPERRGRKRATAAAE